MMNIYRALLFCSMLLCTACAKTAGIPPAELTLSSFQRGANNLFFVDFQSTVDLENAFNDYEGVNQLTPMIICSLDRDTEFSSEHSINIRAEGRVRAGSEQKPNYRFVSDLVFYNTNPDGTQRDQNDYEAIKPLLVAQAAIPCKVRVTAYGYKAYFTNFLYIPSSLMIEQMFR